MDKHKDEIVVNHGGNAGLSKGTRTWLNISGIGLTLSGILKEDYPADLILFDPDKPFKVDRFKLLSKAKNTPFDGYKLYGEVLKTFVRGNEIYKSRNTIDT